MSVQSNYEQSELSIPIVTTDGVVEFINVFAKYPSRDRYSLIDISFSAKKNDILLLNGVSGSGKTTILQVLMRYLIQTRGKVLIDNINPDTMDIQVY